MSNKSFIVSSEASASTSANATNPSGVSLPPGHGWTASETETVVRYYQASLAKVEGLSLRAQLEFVQAVLPAPRWMGLHNAGRMMRRIQRLANIGQTPVIRVKDQAMNKSLQDLAEQGRITREVQNTFFRKEADALASAPALPPETQVQFKLQLDSAVAQIRTEMHAQLREFQENLMREFSIAVQRSEGKNLLHLEKLNSHMQRTWMGEECIVQPLFQQEIRAAQEIAADIMRTRRLANALNEGTTSLVPAVKRKPKVLVYGMKDDQREAVQKEVPHVEVHVSKDNPSKLGDFSMVIVCRDFVNAQYRDALAKKYPHAVFTSGVKSKVLDLIQNNFLVSRG